MTGIKGFKVWLMSEILYDEFGGATVLRSFMKPSKDSTIKKGKKKFGKKPISKGPTENKEVDLF